MEVDKNVVTVPQAAKKLMETNVETSGRQVDLGKFLPMTSNCCIYYLPKLFFGRLVRVQIVASVRIDNTKNWTDTFYVGF